MYIFPLSKINKTGVFAIGIKGIIVKNVLLKYLLKIPFGFSAIDIKV